jgi:NlpC/P60 family protein
MRMCRNTLALLLGLFTVLATAGLRAQEDAGPGITKFISETDDPSGLSQLPRLLDPREILLRLGQQIEMTDLDCSHFVQSLFERAGLYYSYAPSRMLYAGMSGFRRVFNPEPGDLIVWPGHVGIVVDPEEETFLSALRTGVKTSSYTSPYWKRRGIPHFLRYLPGTENPQAQWPQNVAGRRTDATSGSD